MNEWLISAKAATIAGGLAGAAVSVVMGAGTFLDRITRGFVGGVVAFIFAPVVTPFIGLAVEKFGHFLFSVVIQPDPVHLAATSGFIIGVCGMVIAQTIIDAAKSARHKIKRWIGRFEP